jgi:hypothetical protein
MKILPERPSAQGKTKVPQINMPRVARALIARM